MTFTTLGAGFGFGLLVCFFSFLADAYPSVLAAARACVLTLFTLLLLAFLSFLLVTFLLVVFMLGIRRGGRGGRGGAGSFAFLGFGVAVLVFLSLAAWFLLLLAAFLIVSSGASTSHFLAGLVETSAVLLVVSLSR